MAPSWVSTSISVHYEIKVNKRNKLKPILIVIIIIIIIIINFTSTIGAGLLSSIPENPQSIIEPSPSNYVSDIFLLRCSISNIYNSWLFFEICHSPMYKRCSIPGDIGSVIELFSKGSFKSSILLQIRGINLIERITTTTTNFLSSFLQTEVKIHICAYAKRERENCWEFEILFAVPKDCVSMKQRKNFL